ncbi:MAG: adenylate/guanylate cyclase domain-containing protein [Gammaproteobacteria bacterium]
MNARTARTRTDDQRTIMFADIVGSTSLYERLGDAEARRFTAAILARMAEIARAKHGEIHAELGDELMCTFLQPADAAAAACEMHARIGEEFPVPPQGDRQKLRIGMHYGRVVGQGEDLASETAKIAHWAASNAKAEQTLATVSVIDSLPRMFRAVSRFVDDETWNFVSFEHVALYEIIWDVEAITAAALESQDSTDDRIERVCFSFGGDTITLSAERPVISVGRSTQNDLVVKHDLISRQHFTAQFSRGRCTITDKSTNGTLLIPDGGGTSQVVRRDTVRLQGSGQIVVGSALGAETSIAIHYECR